MTDLTNTAPPRGLASSATRHSGRRVLALVGLVVALTVLAAVALYFQTGRRRAEPPAYPSGVGVEPAHGSGTAR